MTKIAPSILSADFANLGSEIIRLNEAGADLIHVDVMDGHFVPNITIGPAVVKSLRKYTNLDFDVHLMISNPEQYIEQFVQGGANIITVHQETCVHLDRTISLIKSFGVKVGVSLNPSTSLDTLEYVLNEVDLVLIMSVNPGFAGQKFIENSLDKISKLRQLIDSNNLNIAIEVDGGITIENAKDVIRTGADILVAGSAVFKSEDMFGAIKELRGM